MMNVVRGSGWTFIHVTLHADRKAWTDSEQVDGTDVCCLILTNYHLKKNKNKTIKKIYFLLQVQMQAKINWKTGNAAEQ